MRQEQSEHIVTVPFSGLQELPLARQVIVFGGRVLANVQRLNDCGVRNDGQLIVRLGPPPKPPAAGAASSTRAPAAPQSGSGPDINLPPAAYRDAALANSQFMVLFLPRTRTILSVSTLTPPLPAFAMQSRFTLCDLLSFGRVRRTLFLSKTPNWLTPSYRVI